MTVWLKEHPEQSQAFTQACDDWVSADRSDGPESRFAKLKAFVIYSVIVPLLQVLHLHTLAYKVGGRWGARWSKQQYLNSNTRFFLGEPRRAGMLIKRWVLSLIRRRKKREPWEVLVQRTIRKYVDDYEKRIYRNAELYMRLKERGEMGETDTVWPISDEEIADFKKALDLPPEPEFRHYPDYSDPAYDI